MKPLPHLMILTQMGPSGWCGVQTHFNAIAQYAEEQGLKVSLVHQYEFNKLARRLPALINMLLIRTNAELAVVVDRFFVRRYLKSLLRKALNKAQAESVVVYAQDPLSARAALDLRGEGFRFRLVCVVHFNISEALEFVDRGIARKDGVLWRSLMDTERFVLPKLDQIVFVSGFMQQTVSARLPELARVPQAVIANFIVSPTTQPGSTGIPGDLITIGTLEARKNQSFLLLVLAECNAMGKRYRLTVAGDGPDRAALEGQVAKSGLAGQVDFLGFQRNAASLIPGHKVLVHPARMENLPITLLEALRVAVPLFAAPVGGIPEVFKDGQEGHYLNLDDPRDAAEKLISILEDREKWQRMSQCAQQTYASKFHPELLGKLWINTLIGT